jgi:hypothetical protein
MGVCQRRHPLLHAKREGLILSAARRELTRVNCRAADGLGRRVMAGCRCRRSTFWRALMRCLDRRSFPNTLNQSLDAVDITSSMTIQTTSVPFRDRVRWHSATAGRDNCLIAYVDRELPTHNCRRSFRLVSRTWTPQSTMRTFRGAEIRHASSRLLRLAQKDLDPAILRATCVRGVVGDRLM